jgi:hypothetical protein
MRAATIVGIVATSALAIRRADQIHEALQLCAALDKFDADEALEDLIDDALTDADIIAAVAELGLEMQVSAKARDIVAARLQSQGEKS